MFREADTETTREWQVWTYARKQIDFCLDNRLRPKPSLHQLGSKSIYLTEFWVPVLGRNLRSLRTSPTADGDLMPPGQALVKQCVFVDVV